MRIEVFFLGSRRRSLSRGLFLFADPSRVQSRPVLRFLERLFAELVVPATGTAGTARLGATGLGAAAAVTGRRATGATRRPATGTTCRPATEVTAAAPVDLLDLGGRPAQRRTDVVGHDLDDTAPLALLGFPAALLEASGHHHPRSLGQGLADVLGHLPPAHDVEEAGALLPLLGLAVHPPAIDRDAEVGVGLAGRRIADLGVSGDIADDGDRVVCHGSLPTHPPSGYPQSSAARRPPPECAAPCGE